MSTSTTVPSPAGRAPRRGRSAHRPLAAATAAGLVLALGLSACGGDDAPDAGAFKRDYDRQRVALNVITTKIGQVFSSADGKSDAQFETEIRTVEKEFSDGIGKLEALDPPKKVQKDFDQVTTIARALDGDLKKVASAAAAHDAAGARAAAETLGRRAQTLEAPGKRVAEGVGLGPAANGPSGTTSTDAP